MNFFEDLKASLRHKWLDYYRVNRVWIHRMAGWQFKIAEGGNRPNSFIILGAMNVLEPDLMQLIPAFSRLTNNSDYIVEVLGLNFDPEKALEETQSQEEQPSEGYNDQ